jgi:two-component system chemotaxis response regulator CheY
VFKTAVLAQLAPQNPYAREDSMAAEILIAEDNVDVRDFLVAALSAAGFATMEAEDGAAVLTRLAYTPPALVLLDLHMPVVDGMEALRRLRSVPSWSAVPVLVLTASGQTDDLVTARRLGARGYLVKPLRPADLVEKVQRVLADRDLLWLDDITEVRSSR